LDGKAEYPGPAWQKMGQRQLQDFSMGKFDSRNSQKMKRRKAQRKKRARIVTRASAVRTERSKKKPSKKKG
jgi:hypothetical protein